MNKKLAKWINDLPVIEIVGIIFGILFLTVGIINVLMDGKLVEKDLLEKFIENIGKVF